MIQNSRLEDLLNLAPAVEEPDPTPEETDQLITDNQQALTKIGDTIDKIDQALPSVTDLNVGDIEMDDLAKKAMDAFEDLQSLGLNVDPRYSGTIFQTAAIMLGHAITAKQHKIDRKLQMVDLQLKKARLDLQRKTAEQKGEAAGIVTESTGVVLDRNELLKQILESQQKPINTVSEIDKI